MIWITPLLNDVNPRDEVPVQWLPLTRGPHGTWAHMSAAERDLSAGKMPTTRRLNWLVRSSVDSRAQRPKHHSCARQSWRSQDSRRTLFFEFFPLFLAAVHGYMWCYPSVEFLFLFDATVCVMQRLKYQTACGLFFFPPSWIVMADLKTIKKL